MSTRTIDEASSNSTDSLQKYRFLLVLFVLVFAVLFRAGNRPLPLLILELSALALLLLCFWKPAKERNLSRGMQFSLWLLVLFPLLYLVPVPWELWVSLPGRELYADTLRLLGAEPVMRAISVYPLKTQSAWLTLLIPVAIFITTLRLTVNQVQTLVFVLLGIAVFEATLGLIQYGEGVTSIFRFGNPYASNGAEGTYANRNHLAGLLEMVLPIGLGLLALSVGHTRSELRYHHNWRSRLVSLSGWNSNKAVIYGFLCLVILLGLVFTQSRTGVALAMLGIFISAIAYSRRLGGTNVFGVVGTFSAVAIALALEVGLAPLWQRFSVDHLENLRFVIFSNTLEGIGTFFPIGSGPGTYPFIYPRFQSAEEIGFINHAHNDYLEWLMEGGFIAGILIVLFLWFYIRRWPGVWVKGYWSTFQFIQVGAGIGVLLMGLHGLTDFNLHIPANAIYFAFLAAVFFYPDQRGEESVYHAVKEKSNTDTRKRKMSVQTSAEENPFARDEELTRKEKDKNPQDIPNPFAEKDEDKE